MGYFPSQAYIPIVSTIPIVAIVTVGDASFDSSSAALVASASILAWSIRYLLILASWAALYLALCSSANLVVIGFTVVF